MKCETEREHSSRDYVKRICSKGPNAWQQRHLELCAVISESAFNLTAHISNDIDVDAKPTATKPVNTSQLSWCLSWRIACVVHICIIVVLLGVTIGEQIPRRCALGMIACSCTSIPGNLSRRVIGRALADRDRVTRRV